MMHGQQNIKSCNSLSYSPKLRMEAVYSSETLISRYKTTRRQAPGSILHNNGRTSLKSYCMYYVDKITSFHAMLHPGT